MTTHGMKFLYEIETGDDIYTWSEIACDARKNSNSQQTEFIQQNIAESFAQMNTDESESHVSNAELNTGSRKAMPMAQDFVQEYANRNGAPFILLGIKPATIEMADTAKRFPLNAASAINPSSRSLITLEKDLVTFAQKNVGQKIKPITSAEKTARGMLSILTSLASGAVNPFDCRLVSRKRCDFVLKLAAMNGKVKCGCVAKITRTGMAEKPDGAQPSCLQGSINSGAKTSLSVIPIAASDAEINAAEIFTPIISNPLLYILNWSQWKRTGLPSAKTVTPKHIKRCRPLKARVLKIEPKGFEQVYDLEIEDTHAFIGNGILQSNSILVDNAGITKNLSVILKERGFELQDLSDKGSPALSMSKVAQFEQT
jgi:hypothetical protein